MLLTVSLVGCGSDSSSCSGGNGRMCDIFSFPVTVRQDQPRLHFASWQVTEGTCEVPRCETADCTSLVFPGLFYQLEVTPSTSVVAPPDTGCRFQISSAEGESLDIAFLLTDSSSYSVCCNSGLRTFSHYSWLASVNGVPMAAEAGSYRLPPSWDGGLGSQDAGMP